MLKLNMDLDAQIHRIIKKNHKLALAIIQKVKNL